MNRILLHRNIFVTFAILLAPEILVDLTYETSLAGYRKTHDQVMRKFLAQNTERMFRTEKDIIFIYVARLLKRSNFFENPSFRIFERADET